MQDGRAIAAALRDPARVGEAVASLMELTGWHTPLALTDDEIRGLVAMAEQDVSDGVNGLAALTLRDLHAAAVALVPGLTIEAMLAAYAQSYRSSPDSPVPSVIGDLAFEADSAVTRTQLWMLFVDGFVAPYLSATGAKTAGLAPFVSRPLTLATPGLALPQPQTSPPGYDPRDLPYLAAHLTAIAHLIPFEVRPPSAGPHEGHGGPGPTVELKVWHFPVPITVVSPWSGQVLITPVNGSPAGLPVTWSSPSRAVLDKHGTLPPTFGLPIASGPQSSLVDVAYQVRAEPGDQSGPTTTAPAIVFASADLRQLVTHYLHVDPMGLMLLAGERRSQAMLTIEWHVSDWSHHSAGGGAKVDGEKCGGLGGQWILDGTYTQAPTGAVQNGTTRWTVTIDATTRRGTYTYTDTATMQTGVDTVHLDGKASGDAEVEILDGQAHMTLTDRTHSFQAWTDRGGKGNDTPAPLRREIIIWEPGGTQCP
jgi:hypothetical protein